MSSKYFTAVVCFLTFNLSSVLGNFLCSILIRIVPRRWQQICVSDLSTCFLYTYVNLHLNVDCFNFQPGRRWILIPVLLRMLFIPFFLLCNYHPSGRKRLWPVLFNWDSAFWKGSAFFGFSGGYLASLSMMHCPR